MYCTGNTLLCGCRFDHSTYIIMIVLIRKYFFKNASEFLEDLKEMLVSSGLINKSIFSERLTNSTLYMVLTSLVNLLTVV